MWKWDMIGYSDPIGDLLAWQIAIAGSEKVFVFDGIIREIREVRENMGKIRENLRKIGLTRAQRRGKKRNSMEQKQWKTDERRRQRMSNPGRH